MSDCKYKLPCGWCDLKNERCEFKNSVSDISAAKKTTDSYTLPISSHCEHIWECIGMSTSGLKYRCSVCGIVKSEPVTNTTEIVARL